MISARSQPFVVPAQAGTQSFELFGQGDGLGSGLRWYDRNHKTDSLNPGTSALPRPFMPQTPRQSLTLTRAYRRGFTLLEILLVVVIVAVTTAVAVPNLFSGPREQLRREAQRLVVALNAARDEAALGGRVIGVGVSAQRMEFFERDPADPSRWDASTRDALRVRSVPSDFVLQAEVATRGARIAFLPSGVSTPFALSLTSPAGSERIVADALGNLALEVKP